MKFKLTVICLSVLSAFSLGCHERDFNSESDGVKSTFKGPLKRKTKRHFVFGVAAPGSKGDKQCWYEAKSEWNDELSDDKVINTKGENLMDRYLDLIKAEPILENQYLMLDKQIQHAKTKSMTCVAAPFTGDEQMVYKQNIAYLAAIQRCAKGDKACEGAALTQGCQSYWNSQKHEFQFKKSSAQSAFAAMKSEKATLVENGVTLSAQVQSTADADARDLAIGVNTVMELLPSLMEDGAACPAASTLNVKQ